MSKFILMAIILSILLLNSHYESYIAQNTDSLEYKVKAGEKRTYVYKTVIFQQNNPYILNKTLEFVLEDENTINITLEEGLEWEVEVLIVSQTYIRCKTIIKDKILKSMDCGLIFPTTTNKEYWDDIAKNSTISTNTSINQITIDDSSIEIYEFIKEYSEIEGKSFNIEQITKFNWYTGWVERLFYKSSWNDNGSTIYETDIHVMTKSTTGMTFITFLSLCMIGIEYLRRKKKCENTRILLNKI